ncbi:MAG: hypothetical protein JO066_07770 [Verrucomicrobia bacterium]|nr:hypothetical protein [Verrucomicrobiota bacterium]MBV9298859.1 hypothetical protein [Verrucomicrobiota bacterium]
MIALRDSLPLLRQRDNEYCSIRQDWLCFCLFRAAQKAGYSRWWLAEHVSASVLCYLSKTNESNVVTSKQLREMVVSALQAIGYAEIALRLDVIGPPFELSLVELAKEAGPGYELEFFRLLKERIQPALCDGALSLEISGLQSCVRHLRSAKTWSRECSMLRNEIVNFLRAHLERTKVKTDIHLTIR